MSGIDQEFPPIDHAGRREAVLRQMGDGVMVLPGAPELLRGRDGEVRYRPDPALFYLTGFPEPDVVAVLTPHDPAHRFTLFVRPRDAEREAWDGARAGPEGARERYGADAAYPIAELNDRLRVLLEPADAVWYALGSGVGRQVVALLSTFRRTRPRSGRGPDTLRDPGAILDPMRRVKDAAEIARMRAAAAAAVAGHRAAMALARPGVGEWEIEAAADAAFRSYHPTGGPSFQTIVGSGANAAVLHYRANRGRLRDGDLVLVDAGAEVELYCSDVTRTFPASGRFSSAQLALYDVVLQAERAAIETVRPGVTVAAVHDAATRALTEGMVELGLLRGDVDGIIERGEHRRFYMHQTSHWIGLEVHDVGAYRGTPDTSALFEPGMTLTVEPGLYMPPGLQGVPQELSGMGVRIEDTVLVTADGHDVLTGALPSDAAAVEAIVSTV